MKYITVLTITSLKKQYTVYYYGYNQTSAKIARLSSTQVLLPLHLICQI